MHFIIHSTFTISDKTIAVEVVGPFTFSRQEYCERVQYLAVNIQPGDSDQVAGLSDNVDDNNWASVPWTLSCAEGM